jgi:hypothetical protein
MAAPMQQLRKPTQSASLVHAAAAASTGGALATETGTVGGTLAAAVAALTVARGRGAGSVGADTSPLQPASKTHAA